MFSRKPAPRQMAMKVARGAPRPWSRKQTPPPELTSGEWSRDSLLIADDPAPERPAAPEWPDSPEPDAAARPPVATAAAEDDASEWSRFSRALGSALSLTPISDSAAPASFVSAAARETIASNAVDTVETIGAEPKTTGADPAPSPVVDAAAPTPAPAPIPLVRRLEQLAPPRYGARTVSPDPDAPTPAPSSRARLSRVPSLPEIAPEEPPAFLRSTPDEPPAFLRSLPDTPLAFPGARVSPPGRASDLDLGPAPDPNDEPPPRVRRLSAVPNGPSPRTGAALDESPALSDDPLLVRAQVRGSSGEGSPTERQKRRRYDRPGEIEPLPPALSSMWRLCKLGYQHEPSLMVIAFAMALLAALPDALIALWLKLLGDGVERSNGLLIVVAAFALALSSAGTWLVRTVSVRVQRTFRDRVTIALEAHVARLQSSIVTVSHQERPEYLDRLSVLRDQVFVLDHLYMSLFSTCGWLLRLGVTMLLLMSVHPVLVFLAICALPPVLSATWRPAVEREAHERGAQAKRLARHLFNLATTAPAGKEVRVTGIGAKLIGDRRAAWDRWYGPVSDARWTSAVFHTLGWLVFGGAYVGAVVFVAAGLNASAAEVLVVLVAGARLSAYVGATVGEVGFLRGIWMDGSRRLVWLEEYAAAQDAHDDLPAPLRLTDGIRFDHVSFSYPGTDKLVLHDVSLDLPAGAVVAIVGENGAGKSTLVKLLGKLYEPSSGEILVDGLPLSRMPAEEWRAGLAGAMQDFYRFELRARQTIGLGDLPRLDDHDAVKTAVGRAGADDVTRKLPAGLDTQLGATWPEGVEVSFGQWQKLALARGFMRDDPLLLILDEPTAALDAETEHALFEKYAAAARGQRSADADGESARMPWDAAPDGAADGRVGNGRITVLVSHRFSTVRMADLIVVLDGARVAEVGSHEELIAKGGQYAELYNIQAAAYR